jgi:glycosyltransferase involved in cell wall biosynthesis
LIFFLSHPVQYVSPLLRDLSNNIDLHVFYYEGKSHTNIDKGFGFKIEWDIPLLEGYKYSFLKNSSFSKSMNCRFFDAVNFDIIRIFKNFKNEIVVLNSWSYCSDWFVLFLSKLYGNKVWLRVEMPWNQHILLKKSYFRKIKYFIFKNIVFKYFIDKFLYIGTENKKYYLNHGVKSNKLIFAPYAVDNNRFQSCFIDRFVTRNKWDIDKDNIIVLFSGKLINKKRPMDLLKAFQKLSYKNITLFFMGDGPLRQELENYINQYSMSNVIISGFINQTEISSIYSMSDIFVMCSGIGETWGLSVNEAMNFNLPILISNTCGSSVDLVFNNENGYIFNEGDIDTLALLLNKLILDPILRNYMGFNSKRLISNYSHKITCQNMINSI